jgi:CHAT domain-containing protein
VGLTSASPLRGTVVVSLALIGDTLLSWTLTSTGRHFSRSHASQQALSEEVNRTAAQLEMGVEDAKARAGLTRLYDDILRKALSPVSASDSVLVLVTDGVIEAAPLGAAFDSVTGTYLIERYAMRYATSVADGLRPATRASRWPTPALVIADPAFAPREYPGLARLPEARAEARAVQSLYPRSVALGDTAASKARVVEAMRTAPVIHFAGHARFDPRNPDASELVLAASVDSTETTARLRAGEISAWRWSHAPLVVLAACESALPRPSGIAGANSLTTAFLTAGARGVVGSLWRVDDALARPLMVEFHRAHRDGGDGAAALRSAQLALLRSSDTRLRSPSAWAAFRYTGS